MAAAIAAILLTAGPAVALYWVRETLSDRLDPITSAPEAVLIAPQPVELQDMRTATLIGEWGDATVVRSPGGQGVVTSISVQAGSEVVTGSYLYTSNDVATVAAATATPFYRSLKGGDRGADVAQLQGFLRDSGYYEGDVDGVFGSGTGAAVAALAEDLGVRPTTRQFDPSWVAWLPSEPYVVGESSLATGGGVPSIGEIILVSKLPLLRVTISEIDPALPPLLDAEYVVTVGSATVAIDEEGMTVTDPRSLEDELGIDDGPTVAQLHLASPEVVVVVPSAAIQTGPDGGLCVWVAIGDSYMSRDVVVRRDTFGSTAISHGVAQGDTILSNPSDILEDATCL